MKKWDLDRVLTRRDCLKIGVWSVGLSVAYVLAFYYSDKIVSFVRRVAWKLEMFFKKHSK